MKKLLLCAALPVLLGACATGPESAADSTPRAEKNEYMTGSNLPRRNRMGGDNVSTMSAEEFAKAQAANPQNAAGTTAAPQ